MRKAKPSAHSGLLNAAELTLDSTEDSSVRGARQVFSRFTKLVRGLVVLAIASGLAYLIWQFPREARSFWSLVASRNNHKTLFVAAEGPSRIGRPWDGSITLNERSREAMGITTAEVKSQDEPIRLELLGTTEYIADTLTKTRSMFRGRVDKVYVTVNQAVKKGDPLIDLYSKELAEAKSVFEIEHIQWIYDKNLLEARERLVQSKAISQQLFEETKNNEMKSHREYEVARHKLFVYGLSEAEVEQVEMRVGVTESPNDPALPD